MTLSNDMMQTIEARGIDVELAARLGFSSAQRGGGELDPSILPHLLTYNPETGDLRWRERPSSMFCHPKAAEDWNERFAGKPALTAIMVAGYRKGHLLGRQVQAHRVVWALQTGQWPREQIDHINGDRSDLRFANLREVSPTENARNQRRSRLNTSGHTGVAFVKKTGKWAAYIRSDGRRVHLGFHDKLEDAASARRAAEVEHGYHANHGSVRP